MYFHSNPLGSSSSFSRFFKDGNLGASGALDIKTLTNLSEYTDDVRAHLVLVYRILFLSLAFCGLGVAVHIALGIGGLFVFLLSLGLLFYLMCDADKTAVAKRMAVLCAFTFLQGVCIGPLCRLAIAIDPTLLLTAFTGTSLIFVCFSISAMTAKRRSWMFLGGFLGSACMLMGLLGVANFFFHSVALYSFHLYGGLIIFSLFVIFDTQLILEKAAQGSRDVVGHSLELFMDFLSIFVRILVILIKNRRGGSASVGRSTARNDGPMFDL